MAQNPSKAQRRRCLRDPKPFRHRPLLDCALIESCPTRIFLPNPDASTPQIASFYEGFGLNAQQLRIIASATPKRDYYYQSKSGNRLFELGLGPIALAAVGSGSAADHKLITELQAQGSDLKSFAPAFFRAKGLPEVADFLGPRAHAFEPKVA